MNFLYKTIYLLLALVLAFPADSYAQTAALSLNDAIEQALLQNLGLKSAQQKVEAARAMVPMGFNLDKTEVFYRHDQNDIAENGYANRVLGIGQSMQFPTIYASQRRVFQDILLVEQQQFSLTQNQIIKEVSQTYYTIVYLQKLEDNYRFLDSLYQQFSLAAERRYELGETNYLEKLTARSKMRELAVRLAQTGESKAQAFVRLEQLIQMGKDIEIPEQELLPLPIQTMDWENHPGMRYFQESVNLKEDNLYLEKQRLLPDLHGEFFRGTNTGPNARVYPGFQVGVSVPLWFGAQKAKINASKFELSEVSLASENYSFQLENKRKQLEIELRKFQEAISFYNDEGKQLSRQLVTQGDLAYRGGEIDFFQYVLLIENSRNIEVDYLINLQSYNMTVLEINYLINP
ncbi:TolC family protein [Lunatimonas salinarum]|uniref:TolC family protein n=1 Tax=Lunatimonas salinarum TaxID=1774590 RepID=UPI001AE0B5C9|nr:TolC family protein [Lunatimonas salinarum]